MKENTRSIPIQDYLTERNQCQSLQEQTLFDFLYLTGARITEALHTKARDIDLPNKRVNLLTEKNPKEPYRCVSFYPNINGGERLIQNLERYIPTIKPNEYCWPMTRQRAWLLSKRYFNCTDHSFRHTNARIVVLPPVSAQPYELMSRYGWLKLDSSMAYMKYAYQETLDKKMGISQRPIEQTEPLIEIPKPEQIIL